MNYLDFSRKIVLYLQLKGLLFKFSVDTTTDMSSLVQNNDGKPFEFSVEDIGKVDIDAINGNGIVATVDSISESGKIEISALKVTAALSDVENIEEKTRAIAEIVITQALKTSFGTFEDGIVKFSVLNANSISHQLGVSEKSFVVAAMKLMVDAVISDYDEVTLYEMNERTLEDLSEKFI